MTLEHQDEVRSAPGPAEAGIVRVERQTAHYDSLLDAARSLGQAKYIVRARDAVEEVVLFGALRAERCVGFLRCFIQVIGRDEGRPPLHDPSGAVLLEGYVDAFGVLPEFRRLGLGRRMQQQAIDLCIERGCYQIRSRSPATSVENYTLKISMGYAAQPSSENDSYYFIRTLPRAGARARSVKPGASMP